MYKKIALACDHRGFEMKEMIKNFLTRKGLGVEDCGCHNDEPADYPDYIFDAAEKVSQGACSRAIGICYTGIGSAIAANKVKGIRAALCQTVDEATLSRKHNDSNMLILGAGVIKSAKLLPILRAWLRTPFEGGRHERRVRKIKEYEKKHCR